jgi:hypothetical protein
MIIDATRVWGTVDSSRRRPSEKYLLSRRPSDSCPCYPRLRRSRAAISRALYLNIGYRLEVSSQQRREPLLDETFAYVLPTFHPPTLPSSHPPTLPSSQHPSLPPPAAPPSPTPSSARRLSSPFHDNNPHWSEGAGGGTIAMMLIPLLTVVRVSSCRRAHAPGDGVFATAAQTRDFRDAESVAVPHHHQRQRKM